MICYKESVNKTSLYTAIQGRVPCIGEHIVFQGNQKEYVVTGIISIADTLNLTVILQPLGYSQISYKDYITDF